MGAQKTRAFNETQVSLGNVIEEWGIRPAYHEMASGVSLDWSSEASGDVTISSWKSTGGVDGRAVVERWSTS
jgi:hypothetical protein